MESIKRRKLVNDDSTFDVLQQEELLVEILSKRPIKDVIRCRSVLKHWSALIKSTYFTNKHFVNHSHDDDDHPSMIFTKDLRYGNFRGEPSICGISLLHQGQDESIPLKLPLPFRHKRVEDIHLLGCSNGLVCILLCEKQFVDRNQENVTLYKFFVWNPTTKRSRMIPEPDYSNLKYLTQGEKEGMAGSFPHVGFGFVNQDAKISTEYKLVRFYCRPSNKDVDEHRVTFRALVFVQNTDSWDTVKEAFDVPMFKDNYHHTTITLNGVVYWKVHLQQQECGIMSFDLRHQVFNLTKLSMLDLHDRVNWGDTSLYSWRNSVVTYTRISTRYRAFRTITRSSDCKDDQVWSPLLHLDNSLLPTLRNFSIGFWKDQFMISSVVKSRDVVYEDASKYTSYLKQLVSYDTKTHDVKTNILKSAERVVQGLLNYTRTLASV